MNHTVSTYSLCGHALNSVVSSFGLFIFALVTRRLISVGSLYITAKCVLTVNGICCSAVLLQQCLFSLAAIGDVAFGNHVVFKTSSKSLCSAFWILFGIAHRTAFVCLAIIALERLYVLRNPQTRKKSIPIVLIGFLVHVVFMTFMIAFNASSLVTVSHGRVPICDVTLFLSFQNALVLSAIQICQTLLVVAAFAYGRSRAKQHLLNFYVKRAHLNLQTRLNLKRSLKMTNKLLLCSLVILFSLPPLTFWFVYGSFERTKFDELYHDHTLGTYIFYVPNGIAMLLSAICHSGLLPKTQRPFSILKNKLHISACQDKCFSGEPRTTERNQVELAEAEVRFDRLNESWTRSYEQARAKTGETKKTVTKRTLNARLLHDRILFE